MLSVDIEKYIMKLFGLNCSDGYKVINLTDGLSSADVYILEILKPSRERFRGTYVLKVIDTLGKWYDKDNNESVKSKRVYVEATSFQKHLVKVERDEVIGDKLVMILSYAFKSKISSISMAQIRLDNKSELLEQIAYDLLAELNADSIEFTDDCGMIESLCSYRLGEDGNFIKRLRQYIFELNKPAMRIGGKILPNPYII